MSHFSLINGVLHAESVALPVIAEQYGTPAYIYSRAALEGSLQEFLDVLGKHPAGAGALVCYAAKANSNLAILNIFARMGAGFDIVSGGELQRVLAAGADPKKIVFSGVGKTAAEMKMALDVGILCFNIESAAIPRLRRCQTLLPNWSASTRSPAFAAKRRQSACASIPMSTLRLTLTYRPV